MINICLTARATVLYRGNLQDTASLVGLLLSRTPIGLIAFTGELNEGLRKYFEAVNRWLQKNDLPSISIHPSLSIEQLQTIVDRPYKQWGWGKDECEIAVKLAGLPFPPTHLAS